MTPACGISAGAVFSACTAGGGSLNLGGAGSAGLGGGSNFLRAGLDWVVCFAATCAVRFKTLSS